MDDPEEISAWLDNVLKDSELDSEVRALEQSCLRQKVTVGWLRGDISEYLRDKYGLKYFLNCNLYL